MSELPVESPQIIVTAALVPDEQKDIPASVALIDSARIERLGEPLVPALLRLTPSAAVSASGPAGSLTQVRIRGAEANHTLLFVDGIRVNDPASGNEPRFELLNADISSRIEVVRGPQSALWGSEAVGGVVAVEGITGVSSPPAIWSEAGSLGFRRAGGSVAVGNETFAASAALGWQRSDGIDAFDGTGDRDGYRNLSGRASVEWQAGPTMRLGASALALTGSSQFDGYDPFTFRRTDTLDNSRNRLAAGRLWSRIGDDKAPWSASFSASLLGSSNRNFLDGDDVNFTKGRRLSLAAQAAYRFSALGMSHRLIARAEHEGERFAADDVAFGGFTSQDRHRNRQSAAIEWTANLARLTGDLAIRHDRFSRFTDATSLRASILADVGAGVSLAASYGEGIAQPSFFDLYGFFPGSFFGNPELKPEGSKGFEASLRWKKRRFSASVTGYRQRLEAEIVDVFDPSTFLASTVNRDSRSRRSGFELEAGWSLGGVARVTAHYAYLDASEPALGDAQQRELRRPRHSGALAVDGSAGRLGYGMSVAYTGSQFDTDFDSFPARRVRLDPFWLAGARLSYALAPHVQLIGRVGNLFDQKYQQLVAHRSEGRTVHAGIRLGGGR